MVKMSTKSRYASRAIIDLAENYKGSPVLLKDIARRQEISVKYLESIMSFLKAANLVKSERGANGGYIPARKPNQIKIREIIELFEGSISIVECVKNPGYCHRVKNCPTRKVWIELSDAITGVLESRTLADLMKRKNLKGGKKC